MSDETIIGITILICNTILLCYCAYCVSNKNKKD